MSGRLVIIPASMQKLENSFSPCSLPPCALNDKSLTGHDIMGYGVGVSPALSSLYLCPSTHHDALFTNQDKLIE